MTDVCPHRNRFANLVFNSFLLFMSFVKLSLNLNEKKPLV